MLSTTSIRLCGEAAGTFLPRPITRQDDGTNPMQTRLHDPLTTNFSFDVEMFSYLRLVGRARNVCPGHFNFQTERKANGRTPERRGGFGLGDRDLCSLLLPWLGAARESEIIESGWRVAAIRETLEHFHFIDDDLTTIFYSSRRRDFFLFLVLSESNKSVRVGRSVSWTICLFSIFR